MEIPKQIKGVFDAYHVKLVPHLEALVKAGAELRSDADKTTKRLNELRAERVKSGSRKNDPEIFGLQLDTEDFEVKKARHKADTYDAAIRGWANEGRDLALALADFLLQKRLSKVRTNPNGPKPDPMDPIAVAKGVLLSMGSGDTYDVESANAESGHKFAQWWADSAMGRDPGESPHLQYEWLCWGTPDYKAPPGLHDYDPDAITRGLAGLQKSMQRRVEDAKPATAPESIDKQGEQYAEFDTLS